jgi:hypothetical protein
MVPEWCPLLATSPVLPIVQNKLPVVMSWSLAAGVLDMLVELFVRWEKVATRAARGGREGRIGRAIPSWTSPGHRTCGQQT